MKKVNVILAAYNGEKYIKEQLISIIENFNNVKSNIYDLQIIVSDDYSSDNTVNIITELSLSDKRIKLLDRDKKGGVKENFRHLIMNSDADYVFFSDQDDYWLPNKIELFLNRFKEIELGFDGPIMIHSDLSVVNEDLLVINKSMFEYQKLNKKPSFMELIVSNSITGCVMACNKPLIEIAKRSSIQDSIMHDWYLALIASAFGVVDFIDSPLILYRQHSTNQVGAKSFALKEIINRKNCKGKIDSIRSSILKTKNQAKLFEFDFSNEISEISKSNLREYIKSFDMSFSYRLDLFLFKRIKKTGILRNIMFFIFYVVKF